MPIASATNQGDVFIDQLDAIIDNLYRNKKLACPGHRWIPDSLPTSIRGHLLHLFKEGYIWQDIETNLWHFKEITSYHYIETEERKREKIIILKGAYKEFLDKYGLGSPEVELVKKAIESAEKDSK